ncbi:MAG: hypothetical protein HOI34_09360 [Rhodospirillaceae bacterium]|nr:hypothetical protein [Rhodospirillaceae bacterium]MBT6203898.1 hypothetical protein [Rhodospirillaceae bacterium]MBT6509954.1 hypothetical protein [Rhodospirillaceae bacterium]MBT7613957.1 hypothetical protein [Rhodospirillaceae bacterium]MBT7645587.1 hypothetical protein [Rhodospirillaceae bacterium]
MSGQLKEKYGVSVTVSGGRTGSFEITRGESLLFSKLALRRFPEDDEVRNLLG